jgi:DNA-binding IclR family transcriptional regulator
MTNSSVSSVSSGQSASPTPRIRAVPAVTRSIAILRLLGRSREPLGVNAIARELCLVPSTALHILRALMAEGLLKVDAATKRYSLGVGMLSLARAVIENSGFSSLVQPELDRISARYSLAAIGVELIGLDYMVVVALARTQAPIRIQVDVGSRFPALISATGRCVAAFGGHSLDELERRFGALQWQNAPSWEAWLGEVETVRRQGYSVDRSNYIAGVTVVAAPVFSETGTLLQSIAAVGLTSQLGRRTVASLSRDMQAAAVTVAAQFVSGR